MRNLHPGTNEGTAGESKPEEDFQEDEMDSPIPRPLHEHWRSVRFFVVQSIAFVIICCGAALAWKQMARPLTFAGQVEVIQASVTSPESGLLTNLAVTSFQTVKAGMPVAEVLCWGDHRVGQTDSPPKRISLKTPIAGIISAIGRQNGEQVLAGQNVLTITSQECKRIVGFIPTSFPASPEVGMKVEVRTRSRPRQKGVAQIVGVGPQWEPVTNAVGFSLSSRPPGQMMGRPVAVSLPPGLVFTPGEPVDLTISR